MYLIQSMREEPLIKVGENFGLDQYCFVSSAIRSVKAKMLKDRKLKDCPEYIEAIILKNQT
jgi:chromosomal replication initiation ATPase DnaA